MTVFCTCQNHLNFTMIAYKILPVNWVINHVSAYCDSSVLKMGPGTHFKVVGAHYFLVIKHSGSILRNLLQSPQNKKKNVVGYRETDCE